MPPVRSQWLLQGGGWQTLLTNIHTFCNQDRHHQRDVVWEQRVAEGQTTFEGQPGELPRGRDMQVDR